MADFYDAGHKYSDKEYTTEATIAREIPLEEHTIEHLFEMLDQAHIQVIHATSHRDKLKHVIMQKLENNSMRMRKFEEMMYQQDN